MDHYSSLILFATSIATALFFVFKCLELRRHASRPFPPGPTSHLLIGNLLSLPKDHEHFAYEKMSKELNSNIISLKFPGTHIIVLHTAQAATELFEKRSANYSDRTNFAMVYDKRLFDWSDFIVFERYGERLKRHRRVFNTQLSRNAIKSFHQSSEHHCRQLLQRLMSVYSMLTSSDQIHREIHRTAAAGILDMAYGYLVEEPDDLFVTNIKEILAEFSQAAVPTNFLVNIFPILAHVPAWIPGAGWKRFAQEARRKKEKTMSDIYAWTRDDVENKAARPSIIGSLVQHYTAQGGITSETEADMKQEGMAMFGAGADTIASSLQVFVLAMTMFPDAQNKAQEELDRVVGLSRLPSLSDRHDLTYVENLMHEVMRWQPIVSLGVPHTCSKDDTYRDYRIPKGAMVFGNLWAMTRDENVYPNPESFNPDRFLDPNTPPAPVFGWGRRKCPGSHYAQDFLFICMASMLATFKFSMAKDEAGENIIPSTDPAAKATLYHPTTFACRIAPRSERHQKLVDLYI
ncbi:cytochrome P450 family protein [Ceratobasidium sp. AG-Ba]|nr:cytochrome P450 family protein [Ceratobasidium sp. AG-Ba]